MLGWRKDSHVRMARARFETRSFQIQSRRTSKVEELVKVYKNCSMVKQTNHL
jgi:hypothetical protein